MPHYVPYHPDPGGLSPGPGALHVNAFTIPWKNFYVFPSFAVRGQKLQKLISDKNTGIVIAPN